MIAEKKLTKSLLGKVNKMGWALDSPTYQAVCRCAFDMFNDYFAIIPFRPDKWVVWLIMNYKKPNLHDGKLNEITLLNNAKTYEEALCKGVALFVEKHFEAYKEVQKLILNGTAKEREEKIKIEMRKDGFDI